MSRSGEAAVQNLELLSATPHRLGGCGVEEVMLQVSPNEKGQTLNNPHAQPDLPGLAGDGGCQLVVGQLPHHHSRQLVGRVELGQSHQLTDGNGLERI